jgi:flagellar export protein FliJ
MPTQNKIGKLIRLRVQAEEQTQRQLAAVQEKLHEAELQLDALRTMADEYKANYLSSMPQTGSHMDQFVQFYSRLSQALGAQNQLVNTLVDDVRRARERYLTAYQARRGLEKLLEKRDQLHKIEALRKERRQSQPRRQPMV